jgi:glyoxylase-like metal-dependent hydrolase (beta-lactamase superfamily II)
MTDMKLYPIGVGQVTLDKSSLTAGRGMGTRVKVPVCVYLIKHPKGNILCDTGMHKRIATDPVAQWGEAKVKLLTPDVKPDEDVVSQLDRLGLSPDDIRFVINTHLHLDHSGCNQHFPKSTFLVQKDELRTAFWPEIFQRGSYYRSDFDHPLKYEDLNGDYDVYGDGTVQIFRTPGHTQGHQSILVNLPQDGMFVITGDCCYLAENVDEVVPPGISWNAEEAVKSIRKVRHLRDMKNAFLLTGHDPGGWSKIKHAPEYYQ